MIHIAYLINTIVPGGPSNVVLSLIQNLDREQYTPVLITLFAGNDPSVVEALRRGGVTVEECRNKSRLRYLLAGRKELGGLLQKHNINIAHSHGLVPDIALACAQAKVKKISTVHCNIFEDYANEYGRLKSIVLTRLQIAALKRFDRVVCCSRSVCDVMQRYLKNCTTVRNGVREKVVKDSVTRDVLGIPSNAKVFVYVGVLSPRKQSVALVQEFAKEHNAAEYLLMVGEGPDSDACEAYSGEHIRFLGFQPEPEKYMDIADIYISASVSEGMSLSVLEALDRGLILFLSDIPSHREIFEVDKNYCLGTLFEIAHFGEALQKLRRQYDCISRQAQHDFYKRYFTDTGMAEQYMQEYRRLAD